MNDWVNSKKTLPVDSHDVLGFWFEPKEFHVIRIFQGEWYRQMDGQDWCQPDFWRPLPEEPKA